MKRLFGTDGIRGVANEYPMTPEHVVHIGKAIALHFMEKQRHPCILIGKDTRVSGNMLAAAIATGIISTGADVCDAGTLPTPAIAFLTSGIGASAGIVISASHNPYFDNGIKVFDGDGRKLSDLDEAEIEKRILAASGNSEKGNKRPGTVFALDDGNRRYAEFLKKTLANGCSFKKMRIAIDCANGATYRIAPELFAQLEANVSAISVSPDGMNINDRCGSQYPEALQSLVKENGYDIGLAFDGDGDRLIAVDESGNLLSGDMILAICANMLKNEGKLKNNRVVSTVMSNMGLTACLKKLGITHDRCDVGDRYVAEKMREVGAVIGGEDSGHMIFMDHHTTGDGILTALKLVEAMQASKAPLGYLKTILTPFPQVLINVDVKEKPVLAEIPEISRVIESVQNRLGENGRVLVRYSGTQPMCRVMVEGRDTESTERLCQEIAGVIAARIGIHS